jgi:hypothetical protein
MSPLLPVHISAGLVGILSGTAICFRKGSPRHALAGKVFVVSMLIMAASAVYLAFLRHQLDNVGGGILTLYLITTAWLTAKRKDGQTSIFDWGALLVPLALGIGGWTNGLGALHSQTEPRNGLLVGMNFFMSSVMLLAAAGIFACSCVVAFSGRSASYGISGGCALGSSSPLAPSS